MNKTAHSQESTKATSLSDSSPSPTANSGLTTDEAAELARYRNVHAEKDNLMAKVHMARSRGMEYIEASKEVIQAYTFDPKADNFTLSGMRVYETGKVEQIQARDNRSMEQINHGK